MEYTIFSGGYTPASLYVFHGAFCLGLLSSLIEIYATIGLGIFVLGKEIYVTIVLGKLVFENYIWFIPRRIQRGWADTPHRFERKNKATVNCIAKIHALECKANLINYYF